MVKSDPKKINSLLTTDHRQLEFILQKVTQLNKLNQRVAAYLDPNLVNYCQVANQSNEQLIIVVANGSIATQLRFCIPDLLKKLQQDPLFKKIKNIQCKVLPTLHQSLSQAVTPKMPLLSTETASLVQNIADSLEDPKLREIMQRIAGHREK